MQNVQLNGCIFGTVELICNQEVAEENMENIIRKQIELKAPVARVWQAITDFREFETWFKVRLDGPFVVGEASNGYITNPGYEHVRWEALVLRMDPERLFAFQWAHVRSFDKAHYSPDYANAPRTLVEFHLEPTPTGTRLTITESGFENIPAEWRRDNFLRNDGGWTQLLRNIERHVAQMA
jgi:uncharacterized protein YndB with AHSA1/START domain